MARTAQIRTFEALGTQWRLDADCDAGYFDTVVMPHVMAEIEAYDGAFSRFRKDSLVSRFAQVPGRFKLPPAGVELLYLYRQLYDLTDGAVTPMIGQALSDAGYDADYSLAERPMECPPAWQDVIGWEGGDTLEIKRPALLDFGAAGKGQLVDIIGAVLRGHGISEFVVDGSGDLLHGGGDMIRIGLEDPSDSSKVVGIIDIAGQALCGSAGNRRRWGRFHHIIDPRTLKSVDDISAVWVVADRAIIADGLATALFFIPPERLTREFDFEYVIIRPDRSARISTGFSGHLL